MIPAAIAAGCAGQSPVDSFLEVSMYVKPTLERFGSLRELTLYGFDADCDGGVFGNGTWYGCNGTSTSNRS